MLAFWGRKVKKNKMVYELGLICANLSRKQPIFSFSLPIAETFSSYSILLFLYNSFASRAGKDVLRQKARSCCRKWTNGRVSNFHLTFLEAPSRQRLMAYDLMHSYWRERACCTKLDMRPGWNWSHANQWNCHFLKWAWDSLETRSETRAQMINNKKKSIK